jgi:hypothetical protein
MRNIRTGIIVVIVLAALGFGLKLLWPKPSASNADSTTSTESTTPTTKPTTRPALAPPPPAGSISITPTAPRQAPSK